MDASAVALKAAVGVKQDGIMARTALKTLFLITLISSGCTDLDTPGNLSTDKKFPDQEGGPATVTITNEHRKTSEIHYQHMAKFIKDAQTKFDSGLTAYFYNNEGDVASRLTADRGLMYDAARNFEAHENVILVSEKGDTLKTEELKWDNNREKIY